MTTSRQPSERPVPGELVELAITDVSAEGKGVARAGRFVLFVRDAWPGERVVARVTRVGRSHGEAEAVSWPTRSAERVPAPCPHQRDCGGCPMMTLSTEAALAAKVRHAERLLGKIARLDARIARAVRSPAELGYRNRLTFAVDRETIGFFGAAEPRRFVPVNTCRLAPPAASALARAFLQHLRVAGVHPGPFWPRRVEMRGSGSGGAWLTVVHARPGTPLAPYRAAARRLVARHEAAAGVLLRRRRTVRLAGRSELRDRIGAVEVSVGAEGFLQVNPGAAARLYDLVAGELSAGRRAPRRVLDLYCGIGLAARAAVAPGGTIVGVERHRAAVAAARRIAARHPEPAARILEGDAGATLRRMAGAGDRFDAAVANPPRAGLGPGVAESLARVVDGPLVVVSCHPAALARDLGRLGGLGFEVDRLTAVDMFPQTSHLELVARLTRSAR